MKTIAIITDDDLIDPSKGTLRYGAFVYNLKEGVYDQIKHADVVIHKPNGAPVTLVKNRYSGHDLNLLLQAIAETPKSPYFDAAKLVDVSLVRMQTESEVDALSNVTLSADDNGDPKCWHQ